MIIIFLNICNADTITAETHLNRSQYFLISMGIKIFLPNETVLANGLQNLRKTKRISSKRQKWKARGYAIFCCGFFKSACLLHQKGEAIISKIVYQKCMLRGHDDHAMSRVAYLQKMPSFLLKNRRRRHSSERSWWPCHIPGCLSSENAIFSTEKYMTQT